MFKIQVFDDAGNWTDAVNEAGVLTYENEKEAEICAARFIALDRVTVETRVVPVK